MCKAPEGGICYSLGSAGRAHLPISAAAIATLYNAGQYDSKLAESCLAYVSKQFDLHKDSFQQRLRARLLHSSVRRPGFYQAGDKYWDKYFPTARDQLIKLQPATVPGPATASARLTAPASLWSFCSFRTNIFRFISVKKRSCRVPQQAPA